jgi:hypothetical protein
VSKSAADRIIDHLGPMLALQPRKRFAKDAVLIVDGTLIPTRNHVVSAQSKNYRYSKSHKQVRARVEHVFARMKTWKHAGQADLAAAHHVELFAEHPQLAFENLVQVVAFLDHAVGVHVEDQVLEGSQELQP